MAQITAAAGLTWPEVLAWRLTRQQLGRRAPRGEALEVVRQICGLHAQVMSSAELTLWARVEDLEPDAVQKALWGGSRTARPLPRRRPRVHLGKSVAESIILAVERRGV